jgi:hypothetical protein
MASMRATAWGEGRERASGAGADEGSDADADAEADAAGVVEEACDRHAVSRSKMQDKAYAGASVVTENRA